MVSFEVQYFSNFDEVQVIMLLGVEIFGQLKVLKDFLLCFVQKVLFFSSYM